MRSYNCTRENKKVFFALKVMEWRWFICKGEFQKFNIRNILHIAIHSKGFIYPDVKLITWQRNHPPILSVNLLVIQKEYPLISNALYVELYSLPTRIEYNINKRKAVAIYMMILHSKKWKLQISRQITKVIKTAYDDFKRQIIF